MIKKHKLSIKNEKLDSLLRKIKNESNTYTYLPDSAKTDQSLDLVNMEEELPDFRETIQNKSFSSMDSDITDIVSSP